jgi:hypothetical protein
MLRAHDQHDVDHGNIAPGAGATAVPDVVATMEGTKSKRRQFETILRKLQVTVVAVPCDSIDDTNDRSKLLVTTGGCQTIENSLVGRFHDRPSGGGSCSSKVIVTRFELPSPDTTNNGHNDQLVSLTVSME